jgi:hypothetical protein
MKRIIVVWFSCGVASAVAAKKTVEYYDGEFEVKVVNNPIDEEHEDNRRFLKDVEHWIGKKIILATNSQVGTTSCVDIWEQRKFMSGPKGAPCTMLLKKAARYEFERNHDIWVHVLGFTADEQGRFDRFVTGERANTISPLISDRVTKGNCFDIVKDAGIQVPEIYKMGFPNANCIGCVKATSPDYWNLVRNTFPDVFRERSEQSRRIGAKLVRVKGKRIFLDELDPSAKGGGIKSWECGIFCDNY